MINKSEQDKTLEKKLIVQFSGRALKPFCSYLLENKRVLECANSNGKIEFFVENPTLEKDISPDAAVGASWTKFTFGGLS